MPKKTGKTKSRSINSKANQNNSKANIQEIFNLLNIDINDSSEQDMPEKDKNNHNKDKNIHKEVENNLSINTIDQINYINKNEVNSKNNSDLNNLTSFEDISEKEINDLEIKQLDKITDEDFEYFSDNDNDEKSEKDNCDNELEEKIEEKAPFDENNQLKSSISIDNKEIEKTKNTNNQMGNNLLKNKNDYNKDNWKKINKEIPVFSMGKKTANSKTIEYDIDNKFISGDGELSLKDIPDKTYFRNIEFQGKKFLIFSKNDEINKYKRVFYYCKYHRTTKGSDKIDKKGNKLRVNICNARIKYDIAQNKYSISGNHSEECENLNRTLEINYAEVKKELDSYDEFRENLKDYLKRFPITNFPDFKKYGQNLYYENKLTFPINNNLYSNLFYNWRKTSNLFNKSCIFEKYKTLDGNQYMRDCSITMLYKKNNKELFKHEHIIFVSDFFIKKLIKAEHFYIDGTFIYPSEFKQLLVILYHDSEKNKRFPGLFALTNNKNEEGYYYLFNKIKQILTIEGTVNLSLKSYTIDFEMGLINSLSKIFPNIKKVGCYFHYTRALRNKANKLKLLNSEKKEITISLLKQLYKAPFIFPKDKNYINSICESFSKKYEYLTIFIGYYTSQWYKYFENGMLDYSIITKSQRSNSYIENYNRRIKLKLSKFLFGKNKTKISWPLFIYFITHEEDEYKKEIFKLDNSVHLKEVKVIDKNIVGQDDILININDNYIVEEKEVQNNFDLIKSTKEHTYNRNWPKFVSYFCRHDTFFLLYTFVIFDKVKKETQNEVINIYNKICQELLQMDLKNLNKGIWDLLDRYKTDKVDLTKYGYKEYFPVLQHTENLNKNKYFCIEYNLYEGCSKNNCIKPSLKREFFSSAININEEVWKFYTIENYLDALFANMLSYCVKCQWKDGISDKNNSPKYFKNFQNIVPPMFLFFSFEDNLNEDFELNKEAISEAKHDLLIYNKLKNNISYIKKLLVDNFIFCDNSYQIRGLICQEYAGHYSAILINLQTNYFLLEKGLNYYYNDRKDNNEIIPLINWKDKLDEEIPVLALYERVE